MVGETYWSLSCRRKVGGLKMAMERNSSFFLLSGGGGGCGGQVGKWFLPPLP